MTDGAVARMGERNAIGLLPCGRDKSRKAQERRFGGHHDHETLRRDRRNRRKILERIVWHLGVERRVDGEIGRLPHADRVAVSGLCEKQLRADNTAAAWPVFHHELLPE